MEKYAILQISDLHITELKTNKKIYKSRMENEAYSKLFIKTLMELQEKLDINIKTIIISGDLANKATPLEYINIGKFIDDILNKLKLKNINCLIVPGNHDINRNHLEDKYGDYLAKEGEIEPYKLQDEKLSKFKNFYDKFYEDVNEKFDCNKAICNKRYIEELNLLTQLSHIKIKAKALIFTA